MRTILWLMLLLAVGGCGDSQISDEAAGQPAPGPAPAAEVAGAETTDAASDGAAEEPQRNMPRLGDPRGLISKTDAATPGYVLYNQLISDSTYLLDLDGQVVHTWVNDQGAGSIYLLDDGTLLRTAIDPYAPVFAGGGENGLFQKVAWDGEVLWEFRLANENYRAHHDIALKPNGNILAIAWEAKTVDEAIAEGRDPEQIPVAGLWPDWIVELRPVGRDDAEIVWEWHFWDHVVQDFDATRDNYGVVAEHPELLDINLGEMPEPTTKEEFEQTQQADPNRRRNATFENRGSDIYHVNAINYNPELELIAFSSQALDEIFVIDNSTTTQEAAGHSGGRWGKGGDLLYRWGNAANYGRGNDDDRRLGGQHDVSWVTGSSPQDVRLLLFNNNLPGTEPEQSAVYELQLPLTGAGFELAENAAFGPAEPVWQYKTDDPMDFFSSFISGAQRLANGNTFVTEGASGRIFEVDREGNVLWEFMEPFSGARKDPDGTGPQPIGPMMHGIFRATHVAADHPALAGRELRPRDPQPPFYQPPAN